LHRLIDQRFVRRCKDLIKEFEKEDPKIDQEKAEQQDQQELRLSALSANAEMRSTNWGARPTRCTTWVATTVRKKAVAIPATNTDTNAATPLWQPHFSSLKQIGNNIDEKITENKSGTITSSARLRMIKLITRMIRIEAVRSGEANLSSFMLVDD
jgi:hypothetical protein